LALRRRRDLILADISSPGRHNNREGARLERKWNGAKMMVLNCAGDSGLFRPAAKSIGSSCPSIAEADRQAGMQWA
jgi:hypothetical protein